MFDSTRPWTVDIGHKRARGCNPSKLNEVMRPLEILNGKQTFFALTFLLTKSKDAKLIAHLLN